MLINSVQFPLRKQNAQVKLLCTLNLALKLIHTLFIQLYDRLCFKTEPKAAF